MWTAAKLKRLTKPGDHCLGNNLYVAVSKSGAKSYFLRYRLAGKRRDMGLGSARLISLDDARQAALECCRLLAKGGDPIAERQHRRLQARVAAASLVTWETCVEKYLTDKAKGWAPTTRTRWEKRMATYAEPILGKLPVSAVNDQLVQRVLSAIWNDRPSTAGKLRVAIEGVIDYAVVAGFRQAGLNPARWKDHLAKIFNEPEAVKPVEHQKALPWGEAPAFFARLKEETSEVAWALRFVILSGGRKMEALKAKWGEFNDFERLMWTPAIENLKQRKQMKGRRKAHNVPLSSGMLAVLDEMRERFGGQPLPGNLVFPSSRPGGRLQKVLSEPATQALIKRLGFADKATTHGFRSSLEDFISDNINITTEARMLMIGHSLPGGDTDAAYMRSDLREQRRQGFEAWSQWLNGQPIDPSVLLPTGLLARRVA
jgi:integrase